MSGYGEYYDWLMGIIKGPHIYSRVLRQLWNTEYYAVVPNDDNRAEDGVYLRYYYEDATGDICEKGGACTFLEFLIGLSIRIENDFLYDENYGDRTYKWFWEMFMNLGLGQYGGRSYDREEVKEILFDFMDRTGSVCVFPVDRNGQWTEMELWWLLNRYILDKFERV